MVGLSMKTIKLETVFFEKYAAPREVHDLTHLYCTDEKSSMSRTHQCVLSGLLCTEFCSCDFHECANADRSIVICDDSDDDIDDGEP